MKNKILKKAIFGILAIILFVLSAWHYAEITARYGAVIVVEYGLYIALALMFYRLYIKAEKCMSTKASKAILALATATLYTTAVWLLNTLYLYIETNSRLPFILMSYEELLLDNLVYSAWKYFIAFGLITCLSLTAPFLKNKVKAAKEWLIKKISNFLIIKENEK
jgi:hypothetical protein